MTVLDKDPKYQGLVRSSAIVQGEALAQMPYQTLRSQRQSSVYSQSPSLGAFQ